MKSKIIPNGWICEHCQNHKQISTEELHNLPDEEARSMDCKNINKDNINIQCCCYSWEHNKDSQLYPCEVKDEN